MVVVSFPSALVTPATLLLLSYTHAARWFADDWFATVDAYSPVLRSRES